MLEELSVHNYALIERMNVKFSPGFNVFTGETGTGKSILIGALGLLLGQKTDTSIIRSGADETLVSGTIRIGDNPEARQWLKEHGASPEDDSIILRRVVKRNGRGSIFIQALPVTLAELRELTSFLFDIHGQHDHQSLLRVDNHRKLLDRYGTTEALALEVSNLYHTLISNKERHAKLIGVERERLREIDLLKYAVAEIDQAALKEGEEEGLEKEFSILSNHEKLFQLLEEVFAGVAESRGGCLVALRGCRTAMDEILAIDKSLSGPVNQLQDSFYELEDFAETIRTYKFSINFDAERLRATEQRLDLIRNLEKKYGDTVQEVLLYSEKCKKDLEELENWEDKKRSLEMEIEKLDRELGSKASGLSEKRKKAAIELQTLIEEELKYLGMKKVRFRVLVQTRLEKTGAQNEKPIVNQNGIDIIEFVISPNEGEPFKRLRKIVSGGEISRIMLAIKSILAESDHISALVFDEIDAGIGGEVALAVGERLYKLSSLKQIFCITHLATIAVRADSHLKVDKLLKNGRTITMVAGVHGDEKKKEISRMLSGDADNEAALKHAGELLRKHGVGNKV
jgi:DNA repair protein RecN (Recombination protein N)